LEPSSTPLLLPARGRLPVPGLCGCHVSEWEGLFLFKDWVEKNAEPKELKQMKQNPEVAKWFEYDLSTFFPTPDLYLDDHQTYALGESKIVTFLTPGHSAGGTSFLVGDMLFSGDLLFYRSAGRTDFIGGSKSELIKSIKRLYDSLPDSTKVYPGHGQSTDLASEKKENKVVKSVTGFGSETNGGF